MSILILAEKPSVARSISQVLGKPVKHEGYLTVESYVVTWAVGHLISLAPPEQYKSEWKTWSMDHLPINPGKVKLVINKATSKQYQIVKELMLHPDIKEIIFATDAGPEGELIARWIYEKTGSRKPCKRLWISSLTSEAISYGMSNLRPCEDFDLLYHSAASRAIADWIIGMNATRAFTLAMRSMYPNATTYTLGRVQTPTLAKLVARELEIRDFVAEKYYEVIASFKTSEGKSYKGKWYDPIAKTGRITEEVIAKEIASKVAGKVTDKVDDLYEEIRVPPPYLLSLSTLQQLASKRLGISVAEVTDIAQSLYEKGVITYPRTADHFVTEDVFALFPSILKSLKGYEALIPSTPTLNRNRIIGEISDHHAIIPTGKQVQLKGKELELYDIIVRSFIAVHYSDGLDRRRTISTWIDNHLFITNETQVLEAGWRFVWGYEKSKNTGIVISTPVAVDQVIVVDEITKPPSRFSEASLIKEMERCNLGTPATRAGTIERLIKQNYIVSNNLVITVTEKALNLLKVVGEMKISSPELTARWEKNLMAISQGEINKDSFMKEVDQFLEDFLHEAKKIIAKGNHNTTSKVLGKCPKCNEGCIVKKTIDKERFLYGCSRYSNGCTFSIYGVIGGTRIDEEDVIRLLEKGKTKLKSFSFKYGPAIARVVLNDDGSTNLEFKNGFFNHLKAKIGF